MPSLPLRRLAVLLVAGALALPIASAPTSSAATGSPSSTSASLAHRAAPSKPVITRTRGGAYARIDFRVARTGGAHWTVIQARGLQWSGDEAVGECHPPAIRSRGTWVGFSPGGSGVWSFQVRVRNASGWSAWSDFGRKVRVR